MTINNQLENTTLTMMIEGRVDTQTAPELEDAIKASIDGVTELVLDFTQVAYISSAGLRTVLAAQNWMNSKNGSMKIRGASKNIINVFKVTGFDTFLNLE
ncbi:MAG: STAS domain-containing protein [Blautia sp.]|nr:STAS domain-containing protein [Blautia sp.]